MNRLLATMLAPVMIVIAGTTAAATPPVTAAPVQANPAPSLRGSLVYVYTFLDARQKELGVRLVDEVNRRLVDDLNAQGVRTKVLRFVDSPEGSNIPSEDIERFTMLFGLYSRNVNLGRSGFFIPVPQIVEANRTDEIASGAKYRLIVFPQDINPGFGARYTIRWSLYDTATSQRVWSYAYGGHDFSIAKPEGYWADRAEKQLDEVIGALKDAGLL